MKSKLPRTPFNSPTKPSRVKYFQKEEQTINDKKKKKESKKHSRAQQTPPKAHGPLLCEKCRSCLDTAEIQTTWGMKKCTDSAVEESENSSFALKGRNDSKAKKKRNITCLKKKLTKQSIEQRPKTANSFAKNESFVKTLDSISKAHNFKNMIIAKGKRRGNKTSRKKNKVENTNISPKKQLALQLSQIETLRRVNEVLKWEAKRKDAIARAEKLRRLRADITTPPLINGIPRRKGLKSKVSQKHKKSTVLETTSLSSNKKEIRPSNAPCRPEKAKMTDKNVRGKTDKRHFHHRQLRTSKGGIKVIVMMQDHNVEIKPSSESKESIASLEYVKDKEKNDDEMPLKCLSSYAGTDEESVDAKDKGHPNDNERMLSITKFEEQQIEQISRLSSSGSVISNAGSILEQTTWNCGECGFENSCQDCVCVLCGLSSCMNEDKVDILKSNSNDSDHGIDDNDANANKDKYGDESESETYSQDSFIE